MILTLRPNADGDLSQLSPLGGGDHYVEVDDTGDGDGDSTYVFVLFGTSYYKDLYHIPNHINEKGIIDEIRVYFRIKSVKSGEPGYAKAYIKTNSTEFAGWEQSESNGIWTLFYQEWARNPATTNPWTWAEIDALQIGVALKANAEKSNPRCTQVWLEVYYQSAVRPKVGGSLAGNRLVGGGLAKCI